MTDKPTVTREEFGEWEFRAWLQDIGVDWWLGHRRIEGDDYIAAAERVAAALNTPLPWQPAPTPTGEEEWGAARCVDWLRGQPGMERDAAFRNAEPASKDVTGPRPLWLFLEGTWRGYGDIGGPLSDDEARCAVRDVCKVRDLPLPWDPPAQAAPEPAVDPVYTTAFDSVNRLGEFLLTEFPQTRRDIAEYERTVDWAIRLLSPQAVKYAVLATYGDRHEEFTHRLREQGELREQIASLKGQVAELEADLKSANGSALHWSREWTTKNSAWVEAIARAATAEAQVAEIKIVADTERYDRQQAEDEAIARGHRADVAEAQVHGLDELTARLHREVGQHEAACKAEGEATEARVADLTARAEKAERERDQAGLQEEQAETQVADLTARALPEGTTPEELREAVAFLAIRRAGNWPREWPDGHVSLASTWTTPGNMASVLEMLVAAPMPDPPAPAQETVQAETQLAAVTAERDALQGFRDTVEELADIGAELFLGCGCPKCLSRYIARTDDDDIGTGNEVETAVADAWRAALEREAEKDANRDAG